MATVWFRCVKRVARVSDVLGAVEHTERQAGQEVARRQVARHRPDCEASPGLQELRDVLQLGNVVLPVATVAL